MAALIHRKKRAVSSSRKRKGPAGGKKANSVYVPGIRTKDWLKIKIAKRQEVVIGGFTRNEGNSKLFSSLLVGVFKNNKLHYTGKIGTGFTDKEQRAMMEQ
jgi:bifunctional non-homologous end joining protein LigD